MMRIHSLNLHNVRGISQLELSELPETGVVVIHGDNEAGKSTIMDAIDACLNYKYSGFPKDIKSLVPADGSGWPEIRLDLSIGPYRMEIYKQFSSSAASKKCELKFQSPKKASLRGDEAENEFRVIISEYLDTDLLDALFVRQGKLHHSLAAAGIPSVESSLQSGHVWYEGNGSVNTTAQDIAGTAIEIPENVDFSPVSGTSTEQAQEESRLLAAVNAEYARYYTAKTGKPAKELKAAEEELNAAQSRYDEAKKQLDHVAGYVAEYEELSEREKLAAGEIPDAEHEYANSEAAKQNAETVQQRLSDAVESVRQAMQQKNSQLELLEARTALIDELKQEQSRRDELSEQLQQAEEAARQEAVIIDQLQDTKNKADAKYRAQRDRHKAVRVASSKLRNAQRAQELRHLLDQVEGIDTKIGEARAELAALPAYIDRSAWQRLRQAHDDVVVEQKLADAHAARLELCAGSPTTVTVVDDTGSREISLGSPVLSGAGEHDEQATEKFQPEHSLALSDGMSVQFGDITAIYRSAQREQEDTQSALSALEQARAHLDELLREFQCSDLESAEKIYTTCDALDGEITALRNRRAGVVGDKDIDDVVQELAGLDQYVNDGGVADSGTEPGTEIATETSADQLAGLTVDEIATELSTAEAAEEQAREELEDAANKLAVYDGRPAETEAMRVRERYGLATERVVNAKEKVSVSADSASMEKLRENVELANMHWQQAINEREAAQAAADDADVSMAMRNWEGAKAHLVQLQRTIREAENRKLALTSHIEAATGAAERLHKAEAALENRKADYAVVERRAHAAARLRETLIRHRDAARQRYMEPFARELERFARVVFDQSVSFELDESLAISQRIIGDEALETEHLSGGAQEQLALLVRFAVAALTAHGQQGSTAAGELPIIPVPVMVDDALGSTDARRLRLMATLFSEIARQTQVFVLTCMPERYSRVVGAQRYSMRELTAG
ncbi:AAA family ATPase [Corynebacterium pseudodiphtheriticum]|uniref:AAA family ATPase n=1 Tax=Corynebacterium pseudodiphtheriticum TaxID=37637 RepID=UPI00223B5B98|nr:AAA family ATPase [Corynebacterium pseudodiphtheriticum]MCT1634280.1 AAA family ATPase [Corynebacterium pseudodiphtheriticum]MCT1665375.1 AAA family ATPase [Corynebacterium pseudodiphtheriticum]MDK4205893.1 AAA family ATPase [Corynebacterium pseudodiphtheriticum]MDK4236166.1 AAA family ATPase [Corynebacterium pseudodiphtheriticum]MDK4283279.1 AAA family ATPase [Corynebacterium pseudodiphtheriticum]